MSQETILLIETALVIAGLIVAIARFKLNSFVALAGASLVMGIISGTNLKSIPTAFIEGMGAVLGSIAMVIALGTMIGRLLAETGGAETVAAALARRFGPRHLAWAVVFLAFIIGLPVWFTVGFLLLLPIVINLAKTSGVPFLALGLPLVAGLSVAHGLTPPHPGPLAAIALIGAQPGKTIIYSIIVALPIAVLVGPLLGTWLSRNLTAEPSALAAQLTSRRTARSPGLALTLFTILFPIALMMAGGLAEIRKSNWTAVLGFLGTPVVALLLGLLFAGYALGSRCGLQRSEILKLTEESLAPVASVLLIVGAGGGFSKVLIVAGVGNAIANWAQQSAISPLLLGWLIAAAIRIATGSATVAITTSAGLMIPIVRADPSTNLELLVVAMGSGSLILSHVNDGGFWIVKEFFNLSIAQTLKSWTVIETAVAILGLAFVLLLNLIC
jgi:GntP family gluconate:H+ symporter